MNLSAWGTPECGHSCSGRRAHLIPYNAGILDASGSGFLMGMSREPEGGEQSQVSGIITLSEALCCLFSRLHNFLSPCAGPLAIKSKCRPHCRRRSKLALRCPGLHGPAGEVPGASVLPSPRARGGQDLPRLWHFLPTLGGPQPMKLLGYETGFPRAYK